jgi:hypothetical protein
MKFFLFNLHLKSGSFIGLRHIKYITKNNFIATVSVLKYTYAF